MADNLKKDPKAKFREKFRRTMMRNDLRDSLSSLIRLYISANLTLAETPVTREQLREIWEEALLQVKITD